MRTCLYLRFFELPSHGIVAALPALNFHDFYYAFLSGSSVSFDSFLHCTIVFEFLWLNYPFFVWVFLFVSFCYCNSLTCSFLHFFHSYNWFTTFHHIGTRFCNEIYSMEMYTSNVQVCFLSAIQHTIYESVEALYTVC